MWDLYCTWQYIRLINQNERHVVGSCALHICPNVGFKNHELVGATQSVEGLGRE